MLTNNLPLKVLGVPPNPNSHQLAQANISHRSRRYISNVIANIFSKAFLSQFTDFSSPLKHPSIR